MRARFRGHHLGVCVLVLSALAQSEPLFAQDAPKPAVVRVYLVSKDIVPKDDEGRAVHRESVGDFYVVKKRDGDRLWIESPVAPRTSGWVRDQDVVDMTKLAAYLDKKIAESPTAYDYYMRATTGADRNDPKKTAKHLADLDEAIRLDPSVPHYHDQRSSLRLRKGDLDGSLADCNEALRLKPVGPPNRKLLLLGRSTIYTRKGELEKAIADVDEALRIDPGYAMAWSRRGRLSYRKRDIDEALRIYNEGIARSPGTPVLWEERAYVYVYKQDMKAALSDLDRAIALSPRYEAALSLRGEVKWNLRDYEGALADFEAAVRRGSAFDAESTITMAKFASFRATCPDPKFRDGRAALELAKKAEQTWEAATKDEPGRESSHEQIQRAIAAAYAELGEFDRAVEAQEKAISLISSKDEILLKRARAHLALYKEKKPLRQPE